MGQKAITYDDVLLVPAYNHYESRRIVDISSGDQAGKLKLDLPVMTSNMDTITEHAMANYIGGKGGIGVLHRFMSIEDNVKEFKKCQHKTFVSIGCSEKDLERVEALRDAGALYFCIDVAHAHAKYVGRTMKSMREMLGKDACIMSGNVATYAGADYLASCGADIIKVGIGGGSVCTTRIKTGFGVPNLTAIQDCARVGRSIIADGGIRTSGDIVKALAFGADFVMIGSMLAGTAPTPGDVIVRKDANGKERKVKLYRGMASREVADDYLGGLTEWKTAEGVATEVAYSEEQDAIIADIIGGLRSGLTYAGSATIRELQRKLNYIEVTPAGRVESLPHRTL
ncbi:MAG: guanosine monophosphate reductase [Bdellovibrionales bacterium RIFOXYD12_FULL_39_22]|nr:MAG: guanosine monophosphate reductase [Bdellovibrionales bacterium RIFOXYB1_FULL_39_21]OFZ40997.1 MAG: guanosine monophosphate reductase [Bdellovibrionales bacterium RIFOXYC12_FULL_39_17]OFZ44825.1 MAG: guanosine monophosphate reductase [Bdellovibrionales bacterium RIFOXYC1_FULL_39_130]OFZ74290.1 MAG: guanosine monophosphate reductase [Bdellovibrionales bacterium RIFOXYD1_FULL_39_84]OFZ92154.1 MAG: guanosine monophosphate reductase [Bdellovibrionales bacterium RIFOXYD12_FULL_39_22]HLE12742